MSEHDEQQSSPMRNRAFRCEDDLWNDAQRVAAERGDNISEILRATLRGYVAKHR